MRRFAACLLIFLFFLSLPALAKEKSGIQSFLGNQDIVFNEPIECLSDNLEKIEKEIKRRFRALTDKMLLLEKSCDKLVYQIKGEKITASSDPYNKNRVQLSFKLEESGGDKKGCFENFLNAVKLYDLKTASVVLNEYKKRFRERFYDLDDGPAHFVDCSFGEIVDSVPLTIHETVHSLRKYDETNKTVYFFAPGAGYIGMPISGVVPHIKFSDFMAKRFEFRTPYENEVASVYDNTDFVTLVDEINAYAVSEGIAFGILKNGIGKNFNRKDPKVKEGDVFLLPIMLALVETNFDILKEEEPDFWNDFCGNKRAAEVINGFWGTGVTLSNEIYNYLTDNKLRVPKFEKKYFEYIKDKSLKLLIDES